MSPLHSLSITVLSTVLLAACATEIKPRAEPDRDRDKRQAQDAGDRCRRAAIQCAG